MVCGAVIPVCGGRGADSDVFMVVCAIALPVVSVGIIVIKSGAI